MVQGVSPLLVEVRHAPTARSGARFPPPSIPGCRRPTCPPSSASSSTLRTPPSFSRCTPMAFAVASPARRRRHHERRRRPASRRRARGGGRRRGRILRGEPRRRPRDPARDALAPSAVFGGVARAVDAATAAAARLPAHFYVSTVLGGDAARALTEAPISEPSFLPDDAAHGTPAWLFVAPTPRRTSPPRGPGAKPPTPPPPPPPPHPHRPGALAFPSRARRSRRTHRPRRVFRHVAPPTQRS